MRLRIGAYTTLISLTIFFIISLPTFEPRVFGVIRQALGFEMFTIIHEFVFPILLLMGIALMLPETRNIRTLTRGWSWIRRISFWVLVVGIAMFSISGLYIFLEKEFDIYILTDVARPLFVMLMTLGVSMFYISFPAFFILTVKRRRGK